jgi:hypothetical protein
VPALKAIASTAEKSEVWLAVQTASGIQSGIIFGLQ